jgi:type VI secretion system (T6SS) baseplate-like injector VgrG
MTSVAPRNGSAGNGAATTCQRFFGKYRGTVINNIDPMQMGRIMAQVPAVSALLPTTWCMPCYSLAGTGSGASFVPQLKSGVWVEFEGGDPDYPIWTGCFYGLGAERPTDAIASNPASPSIVFQSQLQNRIVVSDLPPTPATGGVILKSATGASIIVNDTGIYLDNGKGASIWLVGKQVLINKPALTIS